ncbi:hypothetical protein [Roseovarius sp. Pro17]|uniref:hypothetical protein n=1 Tax=Roseovarius sp. Pro17 TaxID=3108175 RepID=UPI002D76A08F|nr:hypothetical protein [Roseovarius sp. Pro17]
MKRSTGFIFAGAFLGLFTGSSMGVAVGGTAYNAAVFLTPLGAFIGWLLASKTDASSIVSENVPQSISDEPKTNEIEPKAAARGGIEVVFQSGMAIFAALWNFHIDLLRLIGILPTFVRQPFLFAGLGVIVSIFFPPFAVVYFCMWLGANHFGLSEESQYRATIK